MDYFNKSNWSRNIGLRYLIGLGASLSLTLTAFEWKSFESETVTMLTCGLPTPDQMIEIPDNQSLPPPVLIQPEIIETFDEETAEEILLDLTSEFESEESVKSRIEINNSTHYDSNMVQKGSMVDLNLHPFSYMINMSCGNMYGEHNSKIKSNLGVTESEESSEESFIVVEEPAEPEGGMEAFYKYLSRNVKIPSQMRLRLDDTKVFVQFIMEKDGSPTDFKMIKGESIEIYAEVVRVLSNAPKWKPAKQRGRPVRQRIVIPISFHIS